MNNPFKHTQSRKNQWLHKKRGPNLSLDSETDDDSDDTSCRPDFTHGLSRKKPLLVVDKLERNSCSQPLQNQEIIEDWRWQTSRPWKDDNFEAKHHAKRGLIVHRVGNKDAVTDKVYKITASESNEEVNHEINSIFWDDDVSNSLHSKRDDVDEDCYDNDDHESSDEGTGEISELEDYSQSVLDDKRYNLIGFHVTDSPLYESKSQPGLKILNDDSNPNEITSEVINKRGSNFLEKLEEKSRQGSIGSIGVTLKKQEKNAVMTLYEQALGIRSKLRKTKTEIQSAVSPLEEDGPFTLIKDAPVDLSIKTQLTLSSPVSFAKLFCESFRHEKHVPEFGMQGERNKLHLQDHDEDSNDNGISEIGRKCRKRIQSKTRQSNCKSLLFPTPQELQDTATGIAQSLIYYSFPDIICTKVDALSNCGSYYF